MIEKIIRLFVPLCGLSLFLQPHAQATVFPELCPQMVYVSGNAGIAFQADSKIRAHLPNSNDDATLNGEYNPGYSVGGAIGAVFCDYFRAEIETQYKQIELHRATLTTNNGIQTFASQPHAHYRFLSLMANLLYERNFWCDLNYYLGAGIGPSWVEWLCEPAPFTGNNGDKPKLNMDNIRFSWQVMAGLTYRITDCVWTTLGYRFYATSMETKHPGASDPSIKLSDTRMPMTQSIELGIRFAL